MIALESRHQRRRNHGISLTNGTLMTLIGYPGTRYRIVRQYTKRSADSKE